jgi:hypothetical protein
MSFHQDFIGLGNLNGLAAWKAVAWLQPLCAKTELS